MNAMPLEDREDSGTGRASSSLARRTVLDREMIATGAADRRARVGKIKAEMDHACEHAALNAGVWSSDRYTWNRRSWDCYVAEAVSQARPHASEGEHLRQEAAHMDRLLRV